jgi:pyruvate formate lyase activating enzyme
VDPVEKKPLFHFHSGTRVFSIGSAGCNFRCPGCQNWQFSRSSPEEIGRGMERLGPVEAADRALKEGCEGIAWTYNDPAIWIEQTVPGARRARELGLYTVYVTNGHVTPEHLDLIAPHLSAWRVDLKGFSRRTYKRISGVAAFEPVLQMTRRAARVWKLHVECVTNVTPSINDDERELREIARWIRAELGEFTPWHVTRFFPYLDLAFLPATPIRKLERAIEIGCEEGLKYVYIGNVPGHPDEDSRCHECGEIVIARSDRLRVGIRLIDGRCPRCDTPIPGQWETGRILPARQWDTTATSS